MRQTKRRDPIFHETPHQPPPEACMLGKRPDAPEFALILS